MIFSQMLARNKHLVTEIDEESTRKIIMKVEIFRGSRIKKSYKKGHYKMPFKSKLKHNKTTKHHESSFL